LWPSFETVAGKRAIAAARGGVLPYQERRPKAAYAPQDDGSVCCSAIKRRNMALRAYCALPPQS